MRIRLTRSRAHTTLSACGRVAEPLLFGGGPPPQPRHLDADEVRHLRREHSVIVWPRPTARIEGALRKVAEGHVLADRHRRARRQRLLDVDAEGVHLVEEGEATLRRDAAAGEREHLEPRAQQDHLAVGFVEEDDAVHRRQPVLQQVARHLQVGQPGDQRARVDQRVVRRTRRRHLVEEAAHRPLLGGERVLDDGGIGERRDHHRVVAALVLAPPKVERQQVGRRAREAEAAAEERLRAEVLAVGAQLEQLVLHRQREDELLEVVLDGVGQPVE